MLLGFRAPGTSIHCHSFLLVVGPGESDFLHIGLCFERLTSVMMDDGRDELSPESWQECELEKLTAGLVRRQTVLIAQGRQGAEGYPLPENP